MKTILGIIAVAVSAWLGIILVIAVVFSVISLLRGDRPTPGGFNKW